MNAAFEIMIYGMAGIFAAILIIMTVTYLLKMADSKSKRQIRRPSIF